MAFSYIWSSVGVVLLCGPHALATATPITISAFAAMPRGVSRSLSTKQPAATPRLTNTTPSAVIGATMVSGASAYMTASNTTVLVRKMAKAN